MEKIFNSDPRWIYMHTIDNEPAEYVENGQIIFASPSVMKFAKSLKQIKSEQRKSRKWQKSRGLLTDVFSYSYVRLDKEVLRKML